METENRTHPRFCPKGLTATISLEPPAPAEKIELEGIVVDMSYTGIKIKLSSPLSHDMPLSEIQINLTLPESGIPLVIHGVIKHLSESSECGLEYSEKHPEHEVDDLMFECIKISEDHTQV